MQPQIAKRQLALARFKATVGLVDHIGTTATADYTAIAVTVFQRLKAVTDLHDTSFK